MKKQWLITLLLLVGALNLYLLIQVEQQDPRDKERRESLTAIHPDQIERIEIRRTTDNLLFEKQDDAWFMRSPIEGMASAERITELRALAVLTPLARYDAAGMDLSRYGLDRPQLTVMINDTEIAFGSVNPANGRRYVLTGNQLFLIADNIFAILELPARQFLQ